MKRLCGLMQGIAAVAAIAVFLPAVFAHAQERPLLRDGTTTVFQRVLTRPGATSHVLPAGAAAETYPAFQPLYVFAREENWLRVGPSPNQPSTAWVQANQVVEWKQNIVGAFTKTVGRSRQLIFESEDDLRWLMEHEAMRDIQERLVAEATAGSVDGARGVVSVEPSEFVDIREKLYILPILNFVEDLHPLSYEDMLLMQIASVPKDRKAQPRAETAETDGSSFDVGIVFVLDTTQSMEPYIARTQRVLQDTVRRIEGTEIGKLVNFGVIGFRDSIEAAPGLEYRTRTLIGLQRRDDQTPVLNAISEAVKVTSVSSIGFNEDSLAGVEDAIDTIDWDQIQGDGDPIDARYVILVTDAGPKDPRDPNARSTIGPAELQVDAEGRNIAVMTLHLKTPNGQGSHAYAAEAYRQLSRFAGLEFYLPIEGGAEEAFEAVATRLVTAITDHVRVQRGEETVLSEEEAGSELVNLGRAMQLAWTGKQQGTLAPDVITGWVSDKATEAPQALAIEPRLLITKNELSTMARLLENIVTLGETAQGTGDAGTFFGQVRGVVADMATDPQMAVNADTETLGGAIEYLEFLPYRSQILGMTEQRWSESAMLRRSILDSLRQKLALYRKWLFDSSVWTALYENAPDGEHVFAMPFDVLP